MSAEAVATGGELADLIAVGLLVLVGALGLLAMISLVTVLAPDLVKQAQAVMKRRPGRSFLVGLVNFLFFCALGFLAEVPLLQLLAVISLFVVVPALLVAGHLVSASMVGEKLRRELSKNSSLLGNVITGSVTLGLTVFVPIIGWLLHLGMIFTGMGAVISTLVQRKKKPVQSPVEPKEQSPSS